MKSKLLFILLILFTVNVSCLTQNKYESAESEKIQSVWEQKLHNFKPTSALPLKVKLDTTIKINDTHPLHFYQSNSINLLPIHQFIERYWYLPEIQSDSINIKFTCRTQNIEKNDLKINSIDSLENVIKTDTIHALTKNKWITFNKKIGANNVRFLDIILHTFGEKKLNQIQNLWIDKLEFFDDSIPIDSIPIVSKVNFDISNDSLISLKLKDTDFNKIATLKTHKIIALGESMHGSKSINNLSLNLIKHQVKENNCKLVLLEIPLEESLLINRYIQGNKNIKVDTLKQILLKYNYSQIGFIEFFYWLREYNFKHKKSKVSLFGTDISLSSQLTLNSLIQYVNSLQEEYKSSFLEKLIGNLIGEYKVEISSSRKYKTNKDKLKNTLTYLQKNKKTFLSMFEKDEFVLFEYILKYNIEKIFYDDLLFRVKMRDIIMKDNVKFLIDTYCDEKKNNQESTSSVVIYSHLMHINKVSESHQSWIGFSMGRFLKKEYKNDYFSIGILVGEGQIATLYDKNNPIRDINTPPVNSIENVLLEKNKELLYLETSKLLVSPISFRCIFVPYNMDQFFNLSLQNRLDAVFFLEKSIPLDAASN